MPTQTAKPKAAPKKPDPDDGLTQSERFIKAAQELETDDDPERFAERVRKVARHESAQAVRPSETVKSNSGSQ